MNGNLQFDSARIRGPQRAFPTYTETPHIEPWIHVDDGRRALVALFTCVCPGWGAELVNARDARNTLETLHLTAWFQILRLREETSYRRPGSSVISATLVGHESPTSIGLTCSRTANILISRTLPLKRDLVSGYSSRRSIRC